VEVLKGGCKEHGGGEISALFLQQFFSIERKGLGLLNQNPNEDSFLTAAKRNEISIVRGKGNERFKLRR